MNTRTRLRLAAAPAFLLCTALVACSDSTKSELTVEGSYTGSEERSCVLSLREAGTGKFADSASVGPDFRQVFEVEAERKAYFAQVNCPDGKMARSQEFHFEPPRSGIKLPQLVVN